MLSQAAQVVAGEGAGCPPHLDKDRTHQLAFLPVGTVLSSCRPSHREIK